MIGLTAPARLHFGLLSLPAEGEDRWPDRHGRPVLPVRHFGGAGLMIENPALRLHAEPASGWSAEGPLAERALAFARQFAQTVPDGALSPWRLVVESAPPEGTSATSRSWLGAAASPTIRRPPGPAPPHAAPRVR